MSLKTLTPDEVRKLKNIIEEGVKSKQEIQDLNESLKETVKAIAEEIDIKPVLINKAINAQFKNQMEAMEEEVNDVREILDITKVGKKGTGSV